MNHLSTQIQRHVGGHFSSPCRLNSLRCEGRDQTFIFNISYLIYFIRRYGSPCVIFSFQNFLPFSLPLLSPFKCLNIHRVKLTQNWFMWIEDWQKRLKKINKRLDWKTLNLPHLRIRETQLFESILYPICSHDDTSFLTRWVIWYQFISHHSKIIRIDGISKMFEFLIKRLWTNLIVVGRLTNW